MNEKDIELLKQALDREKEARLDAENSLKAKKEELLLLSNELKKSNDQLQVLLKDKSNQLESFYNNIIDAYVVMNLKGHVIEMNESAKDFFGYDIEYERLNVLDLVYKDDEQMAFNTFFDLTQNGFYTNYISRAITKNKEIKWVQVNASLVYDDKLNPIGAQGIIRDITQDKKAENLLVESKNRLSSLILNLDSGILLEDEKGKIVLTNKKFCDLFNVPISPDDLIGLDSNVVLKNSKDLFIEESVFQEKTELLVKNNRQVLREEILMKDRTILERDFIPIKKGDNDGGFLWAYRDVSLRNQYRKSIQSEKDKYSNIIANMNLGLVEIDLRGKILMVNQTLCSMSGFSQKKLIGRRIGKIFPINKDIANAANQNQTITNSYEIKIRNNDKQIRHWLISGAPNYNLKGQKTGSIGICLDITELKELENQKEKILKELEKSNGELQEYAHIVSHDLKSPLRSISALTNWIKTDNKGKFDDLTMQNFSLIESTLEKMDHLISDILIFSSTNSNDNPVQEIDLNVLIDSLLSMLYIPNNISIKVLNKLPVIYGDKIKFQQLFQNLLSNAIKFSDKDEGIIEIDVCDKGSFYQFSIKDNGIGIEKKYHNKIFKIFHSLQESKESTGIGLSIVKKIVDLYKGEVWLESKLKKGTSFFFTIKK